MTFSNLFGHDSFRRATLQLITVLLIAAPALQAQSVGNNAVYNSTGITGSAAYIDASVLSGTGGTDICAKIKTALGLIAASGAVIDARGINSNLSCSSGSPWGGLTNPKPSVVLLPAATITISNTWILPNETRIIGEGSGSGAGVTTIQASSSGVTDPDNGLTYGPSSMVRMGTTNSSDSYFCTPNCFAVGVEDLNLDGQEVVGLSGITNVASQELSYVNRVNLYRIAGTGLQIGYNSSQASERPQNSGPYTNIRFENSQSSGPCAQVISADSTRGIHGLSCISTASSAPAVAVYLDSSATSVEDVYISGFTEGIRIGQSGNAQSNTLLNISTSSSGAANPLIHICGASVCSSSTTISDVTIMAIRSGCVNCAVLEDDLTSTTLSTPANFNVALYALGEQIGNGYSRFTTAKNVPSWVIGSAVPSGACTTGTLYSRTAGTSYALYVCTGASWAHVI